jgi:hypothetical protein
MSKKRIMPRIPSRWMTRTLAVNEQAKITIARVRRSRATYFTRKPPRAAASGNAMR